jgi:hypothetical protein
MAVQEFQGLIDWCAGNGAAPRRRRALGTLVYHYVGRELRGAWNGVLDYSGAGADGIGARFEGALQRISSSGEADELTVSVQVGADGAWVGLRGDGVDAAWAGGHPLVNVHASNGMLEAQLGTDDQGERFSYFAHPVLAHRGA